MSHAQDPCGPFPGVETSVSVIGGALHPSTTQMKNLAISLSVPFLLHAALAAQTGTDSLEQNALEAAFERQMSGCRMVGHFTDTDSDKAPQKDSYTITKVKKLRDEKWQFDATIEYSGKSVTLPPECGPMMFGHQRYLAKLAATRVAKAKAALPHT